MAQGDLTKLEGRLHTAGTSHRRRSRPARYGRTEWPWFLGFSVLCGLATNLGEMILFRVGQGFTGGVLIPTAFTIMLIRIPAGQRAIASAIFGMTVTFAPAIGPTIGGWLTDTYS
jgi:MFS transporter, DHA2 family, multidrug resistance protein